MTKTQVRLLLAGLGLVALTAVYQHVFSYGINAARDVFRLFLPEGRFLIDSLRAGELPLWNPYTRFGEPFAARPYAELFYPIRPVLLWLHDGLASILQQMVSAGTACVGTWLLARRLGRSMAASAVAAGAFGLSPLFTSLATQLNATSAASWTGFMLWFLTGLAREVSPRRLVGFAVTVALSLLAGSPETSIFQGVLGLGLWVTFRPRWKKTAALGAAAAWGVLLSCVQLVPSAELASHSTRLNVTEAQRLAWSMPWSSLIAMAWPHADWPHEEYWSSSEQTWFWVNYVGTGVAVLALFGAGGKPKRSRSGLTAATLLLTGLCLGRNFAPAVWVLSVPPLSYFRYPAKYGAGVAFGLAILAAFGIDRLAAWAYRTPSMARSARRALLWGTLGVVAAATTAVTLPLGGNSLAGLLWVIVVLALTLALWASSRGDPFKARWGLAFIAAVDVGASHPLLAELGHWRALEDLDRSGALAPYLRSFGDVRFSIIDEEVDFKGGFTGDALSESLARLMPLRAMEEKIRTVEGYGAPELTRAQTYASDLNLASARLGRTRGVVRSGLSTIEGLPQTFSRDGLPRAYLVDDVMPHGWFVFKVKGVNADQAFAAARDASEPFRHTAFVEGAIDAERPPCEGTRVEKTHETNNTLRFEVDACGDGWLKVNDQFFPGWEVDIDGQPATPLRTDYLFRAVEVPAGKHSVAWRYAPKSFAVGATLSLVGVLGCAVALSYRRRG